MEGKRNIDFEDLLENEEFIRLLKEDRLQAERLIEDLCQENQDKAEAIRNAASLVYHYHAQQVNVDQETIRGMWNNVLQNSEKKQRFAFKLAPLMRIAASIILLISFTFYFYQYLNEDSLRKFASKKIEISDEARIIISDGSEHKLKQNESHIRYDAVGNQIIIEENNNKTEKLDNHSSAKKDEYNQVVVPYGRRHTLTLSDGTTVLLNSGSSLVFPARFSGKKREVFLKGEGYFDVAKNPEKPFVVNTESINIKVTGTKFNVSAYENENSISAVLVEGSVEVARNGFFSNNRCKITPGQGCFFADNSDELIVRNVDVNQYISWIDGQFQFENQPLASLIKKVEKFYNKQIIVNDEELANRIISGKLVLSEQLEETLDFLAKTTKSRYIRKDDGSYLFTKQ